MRNYTCNPKIDFDLVNSAALQVSVQILDHFAPGGVICGDHWYGLISVRKGRSPASFTVNIRTGNWFDFSAGDSGSDLVSLVARLKGVGQAEAACVLSKMVGVHNG